MWKTGTTSGAGEQGDVPGLAVEGGNYARCVDQRGMQNLCDEESAGESMRQLEKRGHAAHGHGLQHLIALAPESAPA